MESVEVYPSNYLAMESDNTEEIEMLDSTMFEARWIRYAFQCPNIIIVGPAEGPVQVAGESLLHHAASQGGRDWSRGRGGGLRGLQAV